MHQISTIPDLKEEYKKPIYIYSRSREPQQKKSDDKLFDNFLRPRTPIPKQKLGPSSQNRKPAVAQKKKQKPSPNKILKKKIVKQPLPDLQQSIRSMHSIVPREHFSQVLNAFFDKRAIEEGKIFVRRARAAPENKENPSHDDSTSATITRANLLTQQLEELDEADLQPSTSAAMYERDAQRQRLMVEISQQPIRVEQRNNRKPDKSTIRRRERNDSKESVVLISFDDTEDLWLQVHRHQHQKLQHAATAQEDEWPTEMDIGEDVQNNVDDAINPTEFVETILLDSDDDENPNSDDDVGKEDRYQLKYCC